MSKEGDGQLSLQVSIIMPCYNASKFIETAILSVQNQTYSNWELLIIDDNSHDNSLEIINQHVRRDDRIRLSINKQNIGVAKSRNIGTKQAKGRLIAFLDSDDIWSCRKLEMQIDFMQDEKLSITYCSYNLIDKNGVIIGKYFANEFITYKEQLKKNAIGMLTLIYNTELMGKLYFEETGHEDYVFNLNILKKIEIAHGLTSVLASYRIKKRGLSSNKFKVLRWQWNVYRNHENLNILASAYYFLHYAFNALKKYAKII